MTRMRMTDCLLTLYRCYGTPKRKPPPGRYRRRPLTGSAPCNLEGDVTLPSAARDQEQDAFAVGAPRFRDALFDVCRRADIAIADADDDVAGPEPLLGGFAVGINRTDDNPGNAAVDVVLVA